MRKLHLIKCYVLHTTRSNCTFGRLKARWRILQSPLDIKLDNVPNLLYVCFVLNNFCEHKTIDNFGETDRIVAQEKKQQPLADKMFSHFTW